MGRDVAAQRIQLGLKLRVEHVADHRHARRPLRHPAEFGMTELGHAAASVPEGREYDFHCSRRNRVLLSHPLNEIAVDF